MSFNTVILKKTFRPQFQNNRLPPLDFKGNFLFVCLFSFCSVWFGFPTPIKSIKIRFITQIYYLNSWQPQAPMHRPEGRLTKISTYFW